MTRDGITRDHGLVEVREDSMLTRRRLARTACILSALILALMSSTTPARGQSNPAAQLVGKWVGTVRLEQSKASEDRTLVISSVTQQDGRWKADGRFGGGRSAKVRIDVDTTGQWLSLRWTMPNGSTVHVNQINPKTLSGKLTLVGSGRDDRARALTLEKVE